MRCGRGHAPDVVVTPGAVAEIAAIARLCHETRTPLVVRGAGTGYTGGSVPMRGGVVLVDGPLRPHPRDRRRRTCSPWSSPT